MLVRIAVLSLGLLLMSHGAYAKQERILALAPHVCEILFAIGAGDEIVGAVDYCDYPVQARSVPRVGNYLGVNAEAALRLHPTVVIAFNGDDPGLALLRRHGARIMISNPHGLSDVIEDIMRIGRAVGREREAKRLAESIEGRLRAASALVPEKRIPVFYEIWPSPLMTPGKNSYITDLLRTAGFESVSSSIEAETARVGLEGIIRAHPQVVFVPDEARDVEARRRYWKRWLGQKVEVFALPDDLVHRPGPRLVDALERLVRIRLELKHGRNHGR